MRCREWMSEASASDIMMAVGNVSDPSLSYQYRENWAFEKLRPSMSNYFSCFIKRELTDRIRQFVLFLYFAQQTSSPVAYKSL